MTSKIQKLNEGLGLRDFKLRSLLEVTKAINNNFSRKKLLALYEYILKDQLEVPKLLLFNYDNGWQRLLDLGDGVSAQVDVDEDLLHFKEITHIHSTTNEELESFEIVIPVFHKDHPLAFLLLGGLEAEEPSSENEFSNLSFIQTLTNLIVVAIENKRLAKENIKQERLNKELELAAEMQAHLFPRNLPRNEKLEMAGYYQPHQQVGGDYYDVIPTGDEEFVFCMADVSGKGVSAALLMSNFQASLRALVSYTDHSLERMVEELNEKVFSSTEGDKFITFFIGRVHYGKKMLEYINAGHNPPVLLTNEGKDVHFLEKGCPGLGMLEQLPWVEKGQFQLDPRQALICYTDGVTELENARGEEYGLDRLVGSLKKEYPASMDEMTSNVMNSLEDFKEGRPYKDDIALFGIRLL